MMKSLFAAALFVSMMAPVAQAKEDAKAAKQPATAAAKAGEADRKPANAGCSNVSEAQLNMAAQSCSSWVATNAGGTVLFCCADDSGNNSGGPVKAR